MSESPNAVDVLIVEDEPVVRAVMARILEQAGFTVMTAENGLHALTALKHTTYAAVVCDIHMPVLDGVGFYEQLRAVHPDLQRCVLFVTAVADAPGMRAFLEGTQCVVLEKPYELRDFVAAVARLVGRSPARELLL